MKKITIVLFAVVTVFVGCKQNKEYSTLPNATKETAIEKHEVVVNEVVDAETYTYLNVTEKGEIYWMAIPNKKVEIGKTYFYNGGMVMQNFESAQLNKTFDVIVFADNFNSTETDAKSDNRNMHVTNTESAPKVNIDAPKGGISLENLFKNKADYNNKEVLVKGVVTKVNKEIMDRNWIHIVDGTSFDGKNSLTVTSKEMVNVGDTIAVKGVLVLNKDFGQGYIYDILLEEGKLIQ
jgi:hypothetical protein